LTEDERLAPAWARGLIVEWAEPPLDHLAGAEPRVVPGTPYFDATGRVPLAFRGYRFGEQTGLQAQPVARNDAFDLALTEFWQNFPKALAVEPAKPE
jgi:hypothetical protein